MRAYGTRPEMLPLAFTLSFALLAACGQSEPPAAESTPKTNAAEVSAEMKKAAEAISADDMRNYITKLASDEFEGRGTASKGGELAMQYLEQQLKEIGFQAGAADGTYRQTFDVVGIDGSL